MRRANRRVFLQGVAGAVGTAAAGSALGDVPAAPRDLRVLDLTVEGTLALGRRFVLLVPNHLGEGERVPLLVLLHGLGETGDPRLGAYAWLERYGVGTAYDRLRRPPVVRTLAQPYLTDARLAEINASLKSRPFRGLAIACPYTPNVARLPDPAAALDRYASWLSTVVIPRARTEAPVYGDARRTAIDGCSMGGFTGLEVMLRRPELFGAWGGVQTAIGAYRAPLYADRLDAMLKRRGAPMDLHVETSTEDPFHDAGVALAAELSRRSIPRDLLVLPGPHDQPWLREAGTLEMLLWHDRRANP